MWGVGLMKRKIIALASVILIAVLAAAGRIFFLGAALDELPGMAIVKDTNGDRIAVEPTSGEAWDDLVELYHSKGEMWVGGVVEVFIFIRPDPNYPWGFRFNPENITVAEVTAEGLQATLRDISENVNYWIGMGYAYVLAKVVELRDAYMFDVNRDRHVGIDDVVVVAEHFGLEPEDTNWNPIYDIDRDNFVGTDDIIATAEHFGEV
jgi:hypothetical protein